MEKREECCTPKELAFRHAKDALCDGPPYYYKVAYEQAEQLLKALD
jgi:hypothetical protein